MACLCDWFFGVWSSCFKGKKSEGSYIKLCPPASPPYFESCGHEPNTIGALIQQEPCEPCVEDDDVDHHVLSLSIRRKDGELEWHMLTKEFGLQKDHVWPEENTFIAREIFEAPLQNVTYIHLSAFRNIDVTGLDFGKFTPNLRVLDIVDCTIPSLIATDMILPSRLKSLNLSYNMMHTFEVELPPTIGMLDISFNKLTNIPMCVEPLRRFVMDEVKDAVYHNVRNTCKIHMHHNDFWWDMYSSIAPSRVNRESIIELERAHRWMTLSTVKFRDALNHLKPEERVKYQLIVNIVKTTYDNGQNVHISSVQTSMDRAMQIISERRNLMDQPKEHLFIDKLVGRLFSNGRFNDLRHQFRMDCVMPTKHSRYDVTFGDMCEAMYMIVKDMTEAQAIFDIMAEEYDRVHKLCYTGKMTHLVACLNGFVPGIEVGIDKNEELANQMIVIRNKWMRTANGDMDVFIVNAIPEAMQALEDACIALEEQYVWLDAL